MSEDAPMIGMKRPADDQADQSAAGPSGKRPKGNSISSESGSINGNPAVHLNVARPPLQLSIKPTNGIHSTASSAPSTPASSRMGTPATSASYLSKGKRPIRAHVSRPPTGAERTHAQTLANSGIKPSDLNIYTPIPERHLEIQEGRCLKVQYAAASRCHVCSSKAARSECLFHGIRAFILQPPPFDSITLETPSFFFSLQESSGPNLRQLDFNRPITKQEKENLANTVARELLPEIEEAYKHASLPRAILRPEKECHERSCNACKAPFFLRFWFCGDCGRTYCPQCFALLQEEMPARNGPFHSTDPQTAVAKAAGEVKRPGGKYSLGGMNNTKRRFIGCYSGRYHEADCFIAVTTESSETLKKTLDRMQDVIKCTIPQRELAPVTPGPLQRFSIEDKTVTWDASQPIIITGVSENLECDWSPSSFARAYRKLDCHVQECLSGVHRSMKVSDFFETFGQYSPQREGARNLMDWPSNIDLAEWQPDLFQDIMNNIPLPDFTRRNGALNLASRIPPGFNNPVLGPKLYCSQRSQDAKGWGTLKLHVGAADMINVMMHASDFHNKPGEALWHIWPRETMDIVRSYCYNFLADSQNQAGRSSKRVTAEELRQKLDDPIDNQHIYLDEVARTVFTELGAKPWVVRQRVGDAIVIPAGCAVQVCNLADCINVSMAFVSAASLDNLAKTPEPCKDSKSVQAWKYNSLQMKRMMHYTWLASVPIAETDVSPEKAANVSVPHLSTSSTGALDSSTSKTRDSALVSLAQRGRDAYNQMFARGTSANNSVTMETIQDATDAQPSQGIPDSPPIRNRPLIRLRGRSPSQIVPVLKPNTVTSEVARPASTLGSKPRLSGSSDASSVKMQSGPPPSPVNHRQTSSISKSSSPPKTKKSKDLMTAASTPRVTVSSESSRNAVAEPNSDARTSAAKVPEITTPATLAGPDAPIETSSIRSTVVSPDTSPARIAIPPALPSQAGSVNLRTLLGSTAGEGNLSTANSATLTATTAKATPVNLQSRPIAAMPVRNPASSMNLLSVGALSKPGASGPTSKSGNGHLVNGQLAPSLGVSSSASSSTALSLGKHSESTATSRAAPARFIYAPAGAPSTRVAAVGHRMLAAVYQDIPYTKEDPPPEMQRDTKGTNDAAFWKHLYG